MHDAIPGRGIFTSSSGVEREARGDSGNGWLVMVVSRYVGIVKAGETPRLETPAGNGDERRERESRFAPLREPSFPLPSSFLSFIPYPPEYNLAASCFARSRLSRLSNSRFICAEQRVQDEAMQIVRPPREGLRSLNRLIEPTGPSPELFTGVARWNDSSSGSGGGGF